MTDYNTLQKRRNVVVGGFVIIAFAAFIWMIFIFGELPVAVSQLRSFNVVVNFPAVPGVQQNTSVKYCGYQVGRVIAVSSPFRFTDPESGKSVHHVKVTLAIERKYFDIPSHVDILVIKRSMGSSYIDLQVDPDKPLVPLVPERSETAFLVADLPPLEGRVSMSNEFFPEEVQKKLEDLVDSLTILTRHANDIVGDTENKEHVKETLANVTEVTRQARDTLVSVKRFSDSGTMAIESTTEKLNATLQDLRNLLAKANEGDSTAAKLLNDGRLYENLLDSSQELKMTLEQLKKLAAEARENGIKIKW